MTSNDLALTRHDLDVRRKAGWIPADQDELETWLKGHQQRTDARQDRQLHPVLVEFRQLIDSDPVIRMYVERMITEVPRSRSYRERHLHSVAQLIDLIDEVLTSAPEYSTDSMVMTPIGAIFDWAAGTTAGFAAFRDPTFNSMLEKILRAWCDFLTSEDSLAVLNDSPSGWQSPEAQAAVKMDQFAYDPADRYWGFTSWNDFFTRRFKDGQRPVAAPTDDKVIVNACESTPFSLTFDVQRQDTFWIKNQPYSLADMLVDAPEVDQFVGGAVYQAFLSALDYHRWHAPVSGTIVRAFVHDGTYYSEADSEGAGAFDPQNSQGYMAHVAKRAVILIDADDPDIGLVGFVPVGMYDVSSLVIHSSIEPGRHVAKGEELGYFQFGGSTYCLVLRPGVAADFVAEAVPQPHNPNAPLMLLNTKLVTAS